VDTKTALFCKSCDLRHFVEKNTVDCPCGEEIRLFEDVDRSGPHMSECALCGYEHMHIRKEFPRTAGMAIVTIAAVSMWWMPGPIFFLPLILASLLDLALYQILPWKVVCYVCSTEYRGYEITDEQQPFDLEHATEYRKLRWPKKRIPSAG
jgi:hypothetical protein